MVQLEETIVPNLEEDMPLWIRYVDDTFTFIKHTKVEMIKSILDGFHKDIEFTYEIEEENSISFLDVRVIREDGNLITEVFRKKNGYQHVFKLGFVFSQKLENWYIKRFNQKSSYYLF